MRENVDLIGHVKLSHKGCEVWLLARKAGGEEIETFKSEKFFAGDFRFIRERIYKILTKRDFERIMTVTFKGQFSFELSSEDFKYHAFNEQEHFAMLNDLSEKIGREIIREIME